jgi:tetratricopeptide (TPR) repeat protein
VSSELVLGRARTAVAHGVSLRPAAVGIVTGGTVAVVAAAHGGYYPDEWGWAALGFLWIALLALAAQPKPALDLRFAGTIGALAGFGVWIAVTATWSSNAAQAIVDAERCLGYVAALIAVAVVAPRAAQLLGGAVAGAGLVCLYALATRLVPDRLGTFDPIASYRLSEPVGYWNALGIFAALGALLALGFVARARSTVGRALAAASLVVFLPTLYFTYSRGAWIALGAGLVAGFALDRRRLQLLAALLATGPWAALSVWLSSRSSALTNIQAALGDATHEGHRLAVILLVLAVGAAVSAAAFGLASERVRVPGRVQAASVTALVLAAAAIVTAVFAVYGSPPTLARKAYDSFTAPPPTVTGDLNARLFSISSRGRYQQWKTAWHMSKDDPWLGRGAGSYEEYWSRHRPVAGRVKDAHSLYIETLAELGPPGLALLLLALGLPLAAGVAARRHPLVPLAFAAYVAYLVHAGVDWDWEMPAVTLSALLCGAAMLVVAGRERPLGSRPRAVLLAVVGLLGVVTFVGLIGNSALATAQDAAAKGDWTKSESQARKAVHWLPWSYLPWSALGEAQLQRGDRAAARRSFRKAIAKAPRLWTGWFNLARASSGRERLRALDEAVRRNPLSPEVAALRRNP